MAKSRYGKTRQGFQITNCLTDRYGRTTIVAKRANDYIVAKGYNQRGDGTMGARDIITSLQESRH